MVARLIAIGTTAWSLVAAVACGLLLSGVARNAGMPLAMKALLVAVVAATAWRSVAGAIAVAVLVPATYAVLAISSAPISAEALTECFIVAALGGAALRAIVVRDDAPSRLAGAAWVFATIVAASAIVNLTRAGAEAPAAMFDAVRAHLTGTYFFNTNKFLDLHEALRWIEGAAIAVVIERALRREPAASATALRLFLVGGAAAAAFAWLRIADVALRREDRLAAIGFMLRTQRISTLFPDYNAAGSYFALLFVPALWIGVARRWMGTLLIVTPIILLALVVTQSRAALAAVGIVIGGLWILRDLGRGRVVRALSVLIVILGAAYVGSAWTRGTHGSAGGALAIRGEMAKIALKISRDHPVFGAGIAEFRNSSRAYMHADLIAMFPIAAGGENSHNQFLQVLAELGLPGLLAFVALSCGAVWHAVRRPASAEHAALGAGLAAFLISAAFGHPLLIPQVMALFFVALGLCAGMAAPPLAQPASRRAFVAALVAIVVVSVPWRVAAELRAPGPAIVGIGDVEGELDGIEFRRAQALSSWLFSPYARAIEMPMRWTPGGATECTVAIRLDGDVADEVKLSASDWRRVRFPVPAVDGRTFERRLELRVEPAACALLVGPMTLTR